MKQILIIIGLFLCVNPIFSQYVVVRDINTHNPLELVIIQKKADKNQVVTNEKGIANISSFSAGDTLIFRLLGYVTFQYNLKSSDKSQIDVYLEPTSIILDEAVVSGTRWKETSRDIPSKIISISNRDVQLQNPQTAADMLATSGHVFIQKSQLGGGSPMIRGFATNRVLISVDGVRMNNAIFRSGNLQNVISLDPFAIEKTEVLFGPGAVMYGSDAIGGAMNFNTITPRLSTDGKTFIKGNALSRYSSANNEITGHFDVNIGFKKWAFVTSASYSQFDDMKMGSNGPDEYLRPEYQKVVDGKDSIFINDDPKLQVASGYNQLNIMQKVRYKMNDKWDFQYGVHYSATSDVPRYDRLIEKKSSGDLKDAEWYYGPQKWLMNVLNISHNGAGIFYDKMNISLAEQHFEESRHNRSMGSSGLNHRTEKVNALSANIDFENIIDEKKKLYYGFEAVNNQITSEAEKENVKTGNISPLSTRYPDGSDWSSLAIYANFQDKISKKITVQTGLRYNYVMLNADFDTTFYPLPFTTTSNSKGALTGSAGLAYKPAANWQIYGNFSTGFRSPNIDDIGKVFDSEPGSVIVPNKALKPEYVWNFEAGVSKIFVDMVKIDLSAYYTFLSDAHVRRSYTLNGEDSIMYDGVMSKVQALQNAASAYVKGFQAGIEVKLPYGFGLSSRFTYQQGEEELDDGSTAPLRHAVPLFGNAHLTYSMKKLIVDLYGVYQGEIAYQDLAPSEQEKAHLYAIDNKGNPYSPKWLTLNLKIMYRLNKCISLNAGVENIGDIRYRPYSSGIAAAGRNYVVSAKLNF